MILEVKNLVKRFGGVRAINRLSFGVREPGIIGIVGPNGSGKTTLVNLLSGVIPWDEGTVTIGGARAFTALKPYHISFYGITRTFQDVRLFEQMTVLDNIVVVLTERNVFGALFEQHGDYHARKAEEVLQKVRLWEKKNELASALSYGQRKLLEIARALAMKAELYLLDEPFAGLFPEMRGIVSDIIKGLSQNAKTVILIEHNMDIIRGLSDYVFVLNEGALLTEGKPSKVLEERNVVETYLGT